MFTIIMQLLLSGIAMGFIYGLVGIEYTLIWNSTGLLNFSHDRIIVVGAYVFAGTYVLQMQLNYFTSAIMALITLALFGIFIAGVIFIPLRNMSRLCAIMGTVMLGRLLNEALRLIYGPAPLPVKGFFKGTTNIGSVVIANANLYIIAIAIAITTLLQLFMSHTKTGKAMRCVAQNKVAAALMGINVAKNMALTVSISFAICCIIGILIIPIFSVESNMAVMIGLKGFAAGVVGGFGSLPGVLVGGLLIGIVENIGCMIFPSVYKDVVAFVLLIIFLMIRPNGLLGKK